MTYPVGTSIQHEYRFRWYVILLAVVIVLISACSSKSGEVIGNAGTRSVQPIETRTPAGEYLKIGEQPVLRVLIPNSESPARYALTDNRLFIRDGADWVPTPTWNDGRHILVDPRNPDRLFRGDHPPCDFNEGERTTIRFGISNNAGETWQPVAGGSNVRPVAVDPSVPQVIYGSDCGLVISTDLGETWHPFMTALFQDVVDTISFRERLLVLDVSKDGLAELREIDVTDPNNPKVSGILFEGRGVHAVEATKDRIFVGSNRGIFISSDGGNSWSRNRLGLEEVTLAEDELPEPAFVDDTAPAHGILSIEVDPNDKQRVFAGTVRGLYISQDGGATWDRYSEVRLDAQVTEIAIANQGTELFVTTHDGVINVPNP